MGLTGQFLQLLVFSLFKVKTIHVLRTWVEMPAACLLSNDGATGCQFWKCDKTQSLFGPHVFASDSPVSYVCPLLSHNTTLQNLCCHAISTDIYKLYTHTHGFIRRRVKHRRPRPGCAREHTALPTLCFPHWGTYTHSWTQALLCDETREMSRQRPSPPAITST